MLLSLAEKVRFIEYLEIEADSSEQLVVQLEKLGTPPVLELARREKTLAAACRLILARLKSGETQEMQR